MFCCTFLYVHSSIAIILMGKGELVVLLNLSSWCLVMVEWLFLTVPWGCLQFVLWYFLIILTYYLAETPNVKKYSSLSLKLELKGLMKPDTSSSTHSTLSRLNISFQCIEELFQ